MSTTNATSQTRDHGKNRINNPIGNDPLVIWRSLTLRISQEPANIKLHTQRLLFGLENGLSDYVSGALQDLFICLKQKGLPLRQRLFNLTSPVMVQHERAYFQRWLADNSDRNLECYRYPGSVFSSDTCKAVEGNGDSISLGTKPIFKNQLAEARYNLELGQIIKAQALLENICVKESNNLEAINELQNLYTCTKSEDSLTRFTQRLMEEGRSLPEIWQNMVNAAKSW